VLVVARQDALPGHMGLPLVPPAIRGYQPRPFSLDPDYTVRPEPSETLAALDALARG
jgi:hypothetical protein